MAGIVLKFICSAYGWIRLLKPMEEMSRLEFASCGIPYGISLIIETVFTAKMLKKLVLNLAILLSYFNPLK